MKNISKTPSSSGPGKGAGSKVLTKRSPINGKAVSSAKLASAVAKMVKSKTTVGEEKNPKKTLAKDTSVKKGTTLVAGDKAPVFSLLSTSGAQVTLASLKGKRFVLYFYPKDMTGGCTVEANQFTILYEKFAHAGIQIFGVSPDSVERHKKFITKEGISFPLLADPEHVVAEAYGVWGEKSMYGQKYLGIYRTTFVIGEDGRIVQVYKDVKPDGHATCVLADMTRPA